MSWHENLDYSGNLPMWPGLDKAYDKWAEENIDFKPNGIIDIYIANDDPTGSF